VVFIRTSADGRGLTGFPTMVVEPNALPGFYQSTLARFVRAAAVTFCGSVAFFVERSRDRKSGAIRFRERCDQAREDTTHVLIFGGSQGGTRSTLR